MEGEWFYGGGQFNGERMTGERFKDDKYHQYQNLVLVTKAQL